MSARRFLALTLAAALLAALGAPQSLAKGGKSASLVVGKDAKGDWGQDVDPTIGPLGDALGQDLVGASIGMKGKKTVNFVIQLNSLPPWGGWPEITRYIWDFNLDGEFRELDGKFLNYSRGVCDPTSGQCPPPRDPGMQPFFLRGNCTAVETVTTCEELGVVQATFDPGKGTITIPVPLKLLGAKPGSKIQPGANIFGGSISAAPSTFLTSGNSPMDTMVVTKTFQVPK